MKHSIETQRAWQADLSVKREIKVKSYFKPINFIFDTSSIVDAIAKFGEALKNVKNAKLKTEQI